MTALFAAACIAVPSGASAQGEADTFSVYVEADAQAACNNTTLPTQGFSIMQVVPNTNGKDCYWKRDGVQTRSGAPAVRSAIEAARARLAVERTLDAQAARVNAAFQTELRNLRAAQIRREAPVTGNR